MGSFVANMMLMMMIIIVGVSLGVGLDPLSEPRMF